MSSITITDRGPTPRGMRREWSACARAAGEETGNYWHQQLLSKHFTHQGGKEYGYLPRSGEGGRMPISSGGGKTGRLNWTYTYTGRKLRYKHHTDPLVWSGGMKRETTAIRDVRVSGSSHVTHVRVVLHAKALNLRNPKSPIDMRDEISRVSDQEAAILASVFDAEMDYQLNHISSSETRAA